MSLQYLLDGYNIIHQVPQLMHGSLEDRRAALVRWIAVDRPQGSDRNTVTVVFDGSKEHYGGVTAGAIRVVFSDGQNADACIKDMIENAKDPKNFVVVSDDKEIRVYTRALGAKIMTVKEFTAGCFKRVPGHGKGKSTQSVSGQKVSLSVADKINKELERIWLK